MRSCVRSHLLVVRVVAHRAVVVSDVVAVVGRAGPGRAPLELQNFQYPYAQMDIPTPKPQHEDPTPSPGDVWRLAVLGQPRLQVDRPILLVNATSPTLFALVIDRWDWPTAQVVLIVMSIASWIAMEAMTNWYRKRRN